MMKLRSLCLMTVFLSALQPLAAADNDEKLDAILEELKSLHQRVGRLEDIIERLDASNLRQSPSQQLPRPSVRPILMPAAPIPFQPADVLRMQIEDPSGLMKEIHQRERMLRKRQFPAERTFPSPLQR